MMKKYLIIIFAALTMQSCVTYEIGKLFKPSGFSYKYDGEDTGLDSLLYIHGYFMTGKVDHYSQYAQEESRSYYYGTMFYPDGLVCSVLSSDPRDIPLAFGGNAERTDWLYWGRYIISGDTIKIQYISDTGVMSGSFGYAASKTEYKIIDRSNIIKIPDIKNGDIAEITAINKYYFYPLTDRVSSANCPWLKKGWFREKGVEFNKVNER